MRPVVVLYDIGDDARRARLRAVLGPIADRFQHSGWLVPPLSGLSLDRVRAAVEPTLGRGDRVRLHAPCPSCRRGAHWLPAGQPHRLDTVDGWRVGPG